MMTIVVTNRPKKLEKALGDVDSVLSLQQELIFTGRQVYDAHDIYWLLCLKV
jgi:hypothetical protein